jgi:hypothetical protein
MSASDFNELLSAYLDNEVTAEERALVERRLEQSPALRETLDELSEVSEAVRALPRPLPPVGLRTQVLKQVEALSPSVRVRAVESVASRQAISRRRNWTIGSVAAASCVIGAFLLARKPGLAPVGDAEVASNTLPPSGMMMPRSATTSVAMGNALDETRVSRIEGAPSQQVVESLQDLVANRATPPKAGEVLRVIEDSPEVRVHEYMVDDVVEFAGHVRTLLARNGVEPIVVDTPALAADGVSSESSAEPQRLVIYVEGDEAQLDTVFNELDEAPRVQESSEYDAVATANDGRMLKAAMAAQKPSDAPSGGPGEPPAKEPTAPESAAEVRTEPSLAQRRSMPAPVAASDAIKNPITNDQATPADAPSALDREKTQDPVTKGTTDSISVESETKSIVSQGNESDRKEKSDRSGYQRLNALSNGVQVEMPSREGEVLLNNVRSSQRNFRSRGGYGQKLSQNRAQSTGDRAPEQSKRSDGGSMGGIGGGIVGGNSGFAGPEATIGRVVIVLQKPMAGEAAAGAGEAGGSAQKNTLAPPGPAE